MTTSSNLVAMLKASGQDHWMGNVTQMHRQNFAGTDEDFFTLLEESSNLAFERALEYVLIGGFLWALEAGDPEIVAIARATVLHGWVKDALQPLKQALEED